MEERPLLIRMEYADFADYWEPILRGEGPMESYVAGLGEAERARARQCPEMDTWDRGSHGPLLNGARRYGASGRIACFSRVALLRSQCCPTN